MCVKKIHASGGFKTILFLIYRSLRLLSWNNILYSEMFVINLLVLHPALRPPHFKSIDGNNYECAKEASTKNPCPLWLHLNQPRPLNHCRTTHSWLALRIAPLLWCKVCILILNLIIYLIFLTESPIWVPHSCTYGPWFSCDPQSHGVCWVPLRSQHLCTDQR